MSTERVTDRRRHWATPFRCGVGLPGGKRSGEAQRRFGRLAL